MCRPDPHPLNVADQFLPSHVQPVRRLARGERDEGLAIRASTRAQQHVSQANLRARGMDGRSRGRRRLAQTPETRFSEDGSDDNEGTGSTSMQIAVRPTTTPMIRQGQSDPFNALAFPVTAEINEIISSGRDVFLPVLQYGNTPNTVIIQRRSAVSTSQLWDEGSALGLLACYATAISLASGSPAWAQRALHYETQCASLLRERIAQATPSQYPEIITQILSLFSCASLTGRRIEAKPHTTILRTLYNEAPLRPDDITRLCFVLYHERNLSITHMVRSSFDIQAWVPDVIAPLWSGLPALYPHLNEIPTQPLDRSITLAGPWFSTLMTNLRHHYHSLTLTRQRWPPSHTPSDLAMYHLSHSTLYERRLINHYLDLTSPLPASSSPPSPSPSPSQPPPLEADDLWPRASLILAVLYMHHSNAVSQPIHGPRRHDSASRLKAHLQHAILTREATASLTSRVRHQNCTLYALFVGASAERNGAGADASGPAWFQDRFEQCLLSVGLTKLSDGLTKLSDFRAIMLGFPCAPELLGGGRGAGGPRGQGGPEGTGGGPDEAMGLGWVADALRWSYEKDGKVGKSVRFRTFNVETGGFD